MRLLVLVGNTTVRHALVEGGRIAGRGVVSIPPGGPLPSGWAPRGPGIDAAVVASVNPPRLEEAVAALRGSFPRVHVAGRDFPVPVKNRYRDPAQAGIDRLLNALAASRLYPGRGAVVLDFGTALSVSVVSPEGEFLGGPIAAGLGAAAAGLHARTARLPEVRPDRPAPPLLAVSTREALESGIYWQVAGGASRILEGLVAELPFAFSVVATGGDAALLGPAVPRIERVDPDLTLNGLEAAFAAWTMPREPSGRA